MPTITKGGCICGAIRYECTAEPKQYRPGMDIFTASAQPWVFMDPAIGKFPGMPPQ